MIIREEDCGARKGMWVSTIMEGTDVIEPLKDRLLGRFVIGDIINPMTGELIAADGVMLNEDQVNKIVKCGIDRVYIRTILQCKAKHGVCSHCYGSDLASGNPVNVGEAVGIIAAQSIGEPGTQLTMRTFHSGGVAGSDITQGLPRVEELFEARRPKKTAVITEVAGTVSIQDVKRTRAVTVTPDDYGAAVTPTTYQIPFGTRIIVSEGDTVQRGDALTEGYMSPADITKIKGLDAVYDYIIREVQRVYRMQSVKINDKHIEVITRQMTRKVRIEDPGDTEMMFGTLADVHEFEDTNEALQKRINNGERDLRLAVMSPVLLGITKASLLTDSFLSAASFQETTKVLTEAAIKGKVDHLLGLKENVIIGKLIPAGTGMERYRNIDIEKCDRPAEELND